MARKQREPVRDATDIVTQVPASFGGDPPSDSYSKYTFYIALLILLILLAVLGYSYMKGGLPVKVR